MQGLMSSDDELAELFPREMDDLEVLTTVNSFDSLFMVFCQRDHPDFDMDWDSFYKGGANGHPKIYRKNSVLLRSKRFSRKDKLILDVRLNHESTDSVYLEYIVRHPHEDFKGLGGEFYQNMLVWLKERGYRFLVGTPRAENVRQYWVRQGRIPLEQIRPENQETIFGKYVGDLGMVHFLYDGDKKLFLKS